MIAWDTGIREKAVLKPESWKQIFAPVTLNSGTTYPYGFGWFVDEDRGQLRHHHGGAWQGFKTYISHYLGDDITIILLTNLANAEPDVFTDAIAAAIDPKLALPIRPLPNQEPAIANGCGICSTKPRRYAYRRRLRQHAGGLLPRLGDAPPEVLAPLEEPESLQLVERHKRGDDRWYRWRATFKGKTLEITLSLAPTTNSPGFL